MTLRTVARRNGLSPGSARRVLVTLTRLGYVWMKDQRFRLSARALSSRLLLSLLAADREPDPAKTFRTCGVTRRILCASILDGTDTLCIARATARRLERDYMSVGARFAAHATSTGKVLLGALPRAQICALYEDRLPLAPVTAFTVTDFQVLLQQIERVRQDGWSYINQETAMGIASLAVPIREDGEIRYSLSVSAQLDFADNQPSSSATCPTFWARQPRYPACWQQGRRFVSLQAKRSNLDPDCFVALLIAMTRAHKR